MSPEEYTYRWLCIGYEWDLGAYFLPRITNNKMIVQIDGDVFVFEDGLRFNTVTLQIENEAGDESGVAGAG